MSKLKNILQFVLNNFGPIVVFYAANHFYGTLIAVSASLVWTVGEILLNRLRGKTASTFFKFSAAITILFGVLDLYLQRTVFFKYEASASNVLFGLYFGSTLLSKKPLLQEFAEAQGRIKDQINADGVYLFRFLTALWALYFFAKAGFYAWVASRYSLEEGLAIRGTIGSASLYGLLGISIFGAKKIKHLLGVAKLLPSTRGQISEPMK